MFISAVFYCCTAFCSADSVSTDSVHVSQQDSIAKIVALDNVVIEGKKVTHYSDKDVWNITDEMRKNAIDTYDILEKLPGMYIDKLDRKMVYKGREEVVVIIDGKEKDMSYIGNLHNKRFRQIEVYEQSHPRYPNADVVINIITKERWSGFDFSDNISSLLLPSARYGSLFSDVRNGIYYTYTRPKFDFSASLWYNHINRKYDEEIAYTIDNRHSYRSVDDNQPDQSNFSNTYSGWADFDYKINESHSLAVKYSYEHKNFNQWGNTFFDKDGTITGRETRNKDGSVQHTATLFYRGKTKTWTIYSDLGFNLYNDDVFYKQVEASGYQTSSQYHNTRSIVSVSLSLDKKISNYQSLNMYLSGFYRHYEGECDDDGLRYSSENYYAYASALYNYRIGIRLSGLIGVSMVNYLASTEGERYCQTSLSGSARVRYVLGSKTDIMLNLSYSHNTPGYRQTLPFVMQKDSMVYSTGSPSLKTETSNTLSLFLNHGLFFANGTIAYSGNRIASLYSWNEVVGATQSNHNIKDAEWSIGFGIGPIMTKNGRFSGRANIKISGGYLWLDSMSNTYSYWNFISDINYKMPTWGAQLQYSSQPRYSASLQGISKSLSDWWQLSAWKYLLKRRLMIRLTYRLPIRWGIGKNNYSLISTPFYEYSRVIDQYNDCRNSLFVTVRYLLAKGHQVNKQDNNQINKGMVNEINH